MGAILIRDVMADFEKYLQNKSQPERHFGARNLLSSVSAWLPSCRLEASITDWASNEKFFLLSCSCWTINSSIRSTLTIEFDVKEAIITGFLTDTEGCYDYHQLDEAIKELKECLHHNNSLAKIVKNTWWFWPEFEERTKNIPVI
ncbi:MAG: hypothetical protein WCV58_04580 [Patescibacteria group bacterium]|jgi:hypothetical protein